MHIASVVCHSSPFVGQSPFRTFRRIFQRNVRNGDCPTNGEEWYTTASHTHRTHIDRIKDVCDIWDWENLFEPFLQSSPIVSTHMLVRVRSVGDSEIAQFMIATMRHAWLYGASALAL